MNAANKSPLLRNSFKLLLSSLQPKDTIAIVICASQARFVLEPTAVQDQGKIIAALAQLRPGATNFQIATPVGASLALKGIGNAPAENRFSYRAEFINIVRLAKFTAALESLRR
jgi:hypothetical protein